MLGNAAPIDRLTTTAASAAPAAKLNALAAGMLLDGCRIVSGRSKSSGWKRARGLFSPFENDTADRCRQAER